ncbi:YbbC/YhhH family protein [Chitinibacter sp. S2-10]|uniref:YbbC/YhhH family protein n=1 Tax=Chitinibacter sp. S2-10 TaxID=3373597 RepID=UPI003977A4B3
MIRLIFLSFSVLTISSFLASSLYANEAMKHSYVPENGFVPDKRTAINVAEAILSTIYGVSIIKSERPFNASLKNGVWTVVGTLPEDAKGGVAEIEISKSTGEVFRVSHGK